MSRTSQLLLLAISLTACAPSPTLLSPPQREEPLALVTAPTQLQRDTPTQPTPTPEPEEVSPPTPPPIDPSLLHSCNAPRSIVIHKADRMLELRCGDAVAGRYAVSLGFAPTLHKEREGDGRTPEGDYFIAHKFVSQYHRSLQLAYPNVSDAARGLEEGIISRAQHDAIVHAVQSCRQPPQTTMLGSYLQIHGAGGGPEAGDWTLGCVALDNEPIEAVYAFHEHGCHPDGTPKTVVRVLP